MSFSEGITILAQKSHAYHIMINVDEHHFRFTQLFEENSAVYGSDNLSLLSMQKTTYLVSACISNSTIPNRNHVRVCIPKQ